MEAIRTKYLSSTNTRGARIRATWGDDSATVAYPHQLSGEDCHRVAADALRQKLAARAKTPIPIHYAPLVGAYLKPGEYVFIPDMARVHLSRVLRSRCERGEAGNPYFIPAIREALEFIGGDWQSDEYKRVAALGE